MVYTKDALKRDDKNNTKTTSHKQYHSPQYADSLFTLNARVPVKFIFFADIDPNDSCAYARAYTWSKVFFILFDTKSTFVLQEI